MVAKTIREIMITMEKTELQKLPKAALIDIITSELGALNGLIHDQQETIDKLNSTPNRNLTTLFVEDARLSGYTVARDMLLRFIQEKQNN